MASSQKSRRGNLIAGVLILLAVLAASWYVFLRPTHTGATATAWIDGEAVLAIPLDGSAGTEFSLEDQGKPVHFLVEDGKIRFVDVDCPDHICVNTGFIYEQGQTAICMPNKVSLVVD